MGMAAASPSPMMSSMSGMPEDTGLLPVTVDDGHGHPGRVPVTRHEQQADRAEPGAVRSPQHAARRRRAAMSGIPIT